MMLIWFLPDVTGALSRKIRRRTRTPRRAPTVEPQKYFGDLKAKWKGEFPEKIECRVEADRDRVGDILYRRHTGVQGGSVGDVPAREKCCLVR